MLWPAQWTMWCMCTLWCDVWLLWPARYNLPRKSFRACCDLHTVMCVHCTRYDLHIVIKILWDAFLDLWCMQTVYTHVIWTLRCEYCHLLCGAYYMWSAQCHVITSPKKAFVQTVTLCAINDFTLLWCKTPHSLLNRPYQLIFISEI